MEIRDARILILGGSGLVGMAIARELLPLGPRALVICALTEREAREGVQALLPAAGDAVELVPEWGNLFAPRAIKDRARDDVLDDAQVRGALLEDLYGPLSQ
ncbi:MAG TPA: hypothetical protein VEW03_12705, partial [Longimicrobiaceae bacterium]|nr:hypothetical protein [Longimicrobiaceae bacterium]